MSRNVRLVVSLALILIAFAVSLLVIRWMASRADVVVGEAAEPRSTPTPTTADR
jgi:hypothetical protein